MTFFHLKFVTFNTKRVLEKRDNRFVKIFTQKVLHEINIFQTVIIDSYVLLIRIISRFGRIQNTLFRMMEKPSNMWY